MEIWNSDAGYRMETIIPQKVKGWKYIAVDNGYYQEFLGGGSFDFEANNATVPAVNDRAFCQITNSTAQPTPEEFREVYDAEYMGHTELETGEDVRKFILRRKNKPEVRLVW